MPDTPAQMPMARARSAGVVNTLDRIDSVPGIKAAAPTPCTSRPPMSAHVAGARPHRIDPVVNTAMPPRSSRRRPKRSPRVPPVSMRLAMAST